MPQFNLDSEPYNKYAVLVTFTWGSTPTVTTYTDYDVDIVIGSVTYVSCVSMEVESSAKQNGGVTDVPWYIRIPSSLHPADLVGSEFPVAEVRCRIEECDPTDTTQKRTLFYGKCSKATPNKSGFKTMTQIEVGGIKALLQYSSGISVDQQCAWVLGDANCCFDISTLQQTVTVSTLSGSILTLAGITTPTGDGTYWFEGSLTYDNLSILIRSSSGSTFQMERPIPESWLGKSVIAKPGCSRFSSVCDSRFNNIAQFGGFGIAIPAYHPELESGAS